MGIPPTHHTTHPKPVSDVKSQSVATLDSNWLDARTVGGLSHWFGEGCPGQNCSKYVQKNCRYIICSFKKNCKFARTLFAINLNMRLMALQTNENWMAKT